MACGGFVWPAARDQVVEGTAWRRQCRLIAGPALVTAAPRPYLQHRRARRQLRTGIPRLHVLGIDILDRAAGLARHVIAASDGADRVTVRKRTWPTSPTPTGSTWHGSPRRSSHNLPWPALPPVAAALHPSGWPVLGHSKSGGTPVEDTLTRLKTVAYGGTPLDEAAARHLLQQTGLTSVPACSCGSSGGSPVPGGLA
jgi:hypothetical protein